MRIMNHPARVMQTSRLGHWLPSDPEVLNLWLKKTIDDAEKKKAPFHPVIQEFQKLIETDPVRSWDEHAAQSAQLVGSLVSRSFLLQVPRRLSQP